MKTQIYERTIMAKRNMKNRIKKMTFQKQARKFEPISEEHKYMISLMGNRKELMDRTNEILPRITRGSERSQHF
tara:strand:- start:47 stop:268 length:222 start_codon:yes stop_codon:yes gene_type:complete